MYDEYDTGQSQAGNPRIDPELKFCGSCETYGSERHVCTRYEGAPCGQCGNPTVDAQIAAPGYGCVRVCKAGHEEVLSPCGILDPQDVV
jgi:hypothetical protein